jgi:hypothetical protein
MGKLVEEVIAIKYHSQKIMQKVVINTTEEMYGHFKNNYLIYRPKTKEIMVSGKIDLAFSWFPISILLKEGNINEA